ncbi:MAG: group II truncated hemoglobin [Gammaproteobacteria bacterium]|jgi:hemoglobin
MNENSASAYDIIGGETGVKNLVDRFYDYMDELPEAQGIRSLHAKSLKGSREKLFLFLSGWLGGPDLYIQKYGHPMLRRRHLPFPIGVSERDQWMFCMKKALADLQLPKEIEEQLIKAFFQTADHMRNKPEHDEDSAELKIFSPTNSPGTK